MAAKALVLMDFRDRVAQMAVDAEGGAGDRKAMVMAMAWGGRVDVGVGVGEVVGPVAADAFGVRGDGDHP